MSNYLHQLKSEGFKGLFLPFETCSNATLKCSDYCYQKQEKHPNEEDKAKTLAFLFDETPYEIAEILYTELDGDILHWFVSGDCWNGSSRFFNAVMYKLHSLGVTQYGFTRNIKLWEMVPDILILSLDDEVEYNKFIEQLDRELPYRNELFYEKHNVRVAIPKNICRNKKDCGVDIFRLVIQKRKVTRRVKLGGCGDDEYDYPTTELFTSSKKVKRLQNCSRCFLRRKGCFNNKKDKIKFSEHYHDKLSILDQPIPIQQKVLAFKYRWMKWGCCQNYIFKME